MQGSRQVDVGYETAPPADQGRIFPTRRSCAYPLRGGHDVTSFISRAAPSTDSTIF